MRPAFFAAALLGLVPLALVRASFVPATDPAFHFEGRIDARHAEAPILVWQASEIDVQFSGPTVALRFGTAAGQNFFNVSVDGAEEVLAVPAGTSAQLPVAVSGTAAWHHLRLFKRSEANAGTAVFLGIELGAGGQAQSEPAPSDRMRFEFIGDSITVGACNEDKAGDQWESRRTHNAALSYAALVASAFQATHRNIAVSGMGICVGYVPMIAGQVWDRLEPSPSAERADLRRSPPQVVFINFGENDASYSTLHGLAFPSGFTSGYVDLVHAIRAAYPAAQVVLLRGGMFNGANNEKLRQSWERAVAALEARDERVHHFGFHHWSSLHPRVPDDRAMAEELVSWLRRQQFMAVRDRPQS